jgi:endonuclease YncB( thermonuclease family)
MMRRSKTIVHFPSGGSRGRRRRRRKPPMATILCLAIVIAAVSTLAAMELLEVDLPASWQGGSTSAGVGDIVGRATVTDGDTLAIRKHRIRLHGIDAPESGQTCQDGAGRDYRCGQRAALALSDKIGQQAVSCEERDVDRYGRVVAVCFAGGIDLNGWLVQQGWAVAYTRYSRDYAGAEDEAKSNGRGIWAGDFQQPEAWRRR